MITEESIEDSFASQLDLGHAIEVVAHDPRGGRARVTS
jgi:hypothetical protein